RRHLEIVCSLWDTIGRHLTGVLPSVNVCIQHIRLPSCAGSDGIISLPVIPEAHEHALNGCVRSNPHPSIPVAGDKRDSNLDKEKHMGVKIRQKDGKWYVFIN